MAPKLESNNEMSDSREWKTVLNKWGETSEERHGLGLEEEKLFDGTKDEPHLPSILRFESTFFQLVSVYMFSEGLLDTKFPRWIAQLQ